MFVQIREKYRKYTKSNQKMVSEIYTIIKKETIEKIQQEFRIQRVFFNPNHFHTKIKKPYKKSKKFHTKSVHNKFKFF